MASEPTQEELEAIVDSVLTAAVVKLLRDSLLAAAKELWTSVYNTGAEDKEQEIKDFLDQP